MKSLGAWGKVFSHWEQGEHEFLPAEPGVEGQVLRVQVHQAALTRRRRQRGVPVSGTGFHSRFMPGGVTAATELSGAVPGGLSVGTRRQTPRIVAESAAMAAARFPTAPTAFVPADVAARWQGRIYAYLPQQRYVSERLSLEGKFGFQPGQWHRCDAGVGVEPPGRTDGSVKLWLDGVLVGAVRRDW